MLSVVGVGAGCDDQGALCIHHHSSHTLHGAPSLLHQCQAGND